MDYETCRQNLEALAQYYSDNEANRNEATTRLQLIDQIFFECLAWKRNNCIAEEPHGNEYTDYTFITTKRVLIVEAKKEGNYLELPLGQESREYAISTICKDNPNLKTAISQAAGYCQSRGVTIGCVCNGHQLVAFIATRSDGVPPMEGRALVFQSFGAMLGDFLTLWNSLSPFGIGESYLLFRLLGQSPSKLPLKLSDLIAGYPGFKNRNPFQTDLKILSDLVLEDLPKNEDLEEEFLKECYSQSGAISQHSLVSKEILRTRYHALFDETVPGPTLISAVTKQGVSQGLLGESMSNRPILLIGDVGVGKTTFIRNLIKVDAQDLFLNTYAFHLDLGIKAALSLDMRTFVLDEIIEQLRKKYSIDIYKNNFIRGVYHGELQRFKDGIYSKLQETNPEKFVEKELEFLEELTILKDKHLRLSLDHLSKARRKQIVVFIDNTDQRSDEEQQKAFLISQEMASNWPVMVFLSLRPETFHKSKKTGTISGYHPKAFTISPPRIDRVLKDRLKFGLRIAKGELKSITLNSAISTKLSSLAALLQVFLESLSFNDDLIKAIDNISGGNIRRALDLVRDFFGSGHVDTRKIVNIYQKQGNYYVPVHELLRSVLHGDCQNYDPNQSQIPNLLNIFHSDPKEHFLKPIFILTMESLARNYSDAGFVDSERIYSSLQNLGFTPTQIDVNLMRSMDTGLIIPSGDRTFTGEQNLSRSYRVSTLGAYCVHFLLNNFVYIDAIIVDTPILNKEIRSKIKDAVDIEDRLERTEIFRGYLDALWSDYGLQSDIFDWRIYSENISRDISKIKNFIERRKTSVK